MAKNIKNKTKNEKLGELILTIDAHEKVDSLTLSDDISKEYQSKSNREFLFALYMQNMKNDKMTTIIGHVLEDCENLSKTEIIDRINSEYSANKPQNVPHEGLKSGDHITLNIYKSDDTQNSIYNLEAQIKKTKNGIKYAEIEKNFTNEEYRRCGLMRLGFDNFQNYLQENNIQKITLEAIDLDGNEFNLNSLYTKFGFDKHGDKFVKDVSQREYY